MKKFVHKLFNWKVPSSLPIRSFSKEGDYTWEDWHQEMKKKFPLKHLLLEEIPVQITCYYDRLERKLYHLNSILWKHQYLLDLRQPKNSQYFLQYRSGYSDVRQRMIYANLNLLREFVECEWGGVEKIQSHIDWLTERNNDEMPTTGWIDFYNFVLAEYAWWHEELPQLCKQLEQQNTLELENKIENDIDEHLSQLMKQRQCFWT